MIRVALVRNPLSTRNRNSAGGSLPALPEGVRLVETSTINALAGRLAAKRAMGVDLILIDGGDGTVREVLSLLPEIWRTALPRVGILPHGNTNLIAREVGGLHSPKAISEILRRHAAGEALPTQRRTLLRVDYPAGEHRTLRGFMFGWGAYATGTRIAREEIAGHGSRQVASTVLATLRRTLIGSNRTTLRRGVATELSIDGHAQPSGTRLVGLATTLQGRLIAGIHPFWSGGHGAIRWLDIRAPGHRLALAVPFLAVGKPRGWMRRSGYTSGRASQIELALDTSFVLDGELFPPGESGPLRLSADEEVDFISL